MTGGTSGGGRIDDYTFLKEVAPKEFGEVVAGSTGGGIGQGFRSMLEVYEGLQTSGRLLGGSSLLNDEKLLG